MQLLNLRYVAIGALEIEDIRATLPDCSSGICVMRNNAAAAPAAPAAPAANASLNDSQMDELVRKIIERLQNA